MLTRMSCQGHVIYFHFYNFIDLTVNAPSSLSFEHFSQKKLIFVYKCMKLAHVLNNVSKETDSRILFPVAKRMILFPFCLNS